MSAYMRFSHYPSDAVLKQEWFALQCSLTSLRARLLVRRIDRMRSESRCAVSMATQLLGRPAAHRGANRRAASNTAGLLDSLSTDSRHLLTYAERLAERPTLPHEQRFRLEDAASDLRELSKYTFAMREELIAKYCVFR